MKIGELSNRTGTPVRTIRFYEDEGVLPVPARTDAGYRDYDDADVRRLRFVSASQRAGLRLAEISSILALREAGEAPCSHSTALLRAKRQEIDARLSELRDMRHEVDALLARSASLDPANCDPAGICQVISK